MPLEKLKVFISWSGERSRTVGEALREWLPNVLSMAEPWMSASDVEKGAKWNQVVSGELETNNFSIICLTPENLGAPWLLFEAGALSKKAESRALTYLFDLEYSDVKDPLSQFQHTKANESETRRLVETINNHMGEATLPKDRLHKIFEKWWPDLAAHLAGVTPAGPKTDGRNRVPEMISEILERVREQGRQLQRLELGDSVSRFPPVRIPSQTELDTFAARLQKQLESIGHPGAVSVEGNEIGIGSARVSFGLARNLLLHSPTFTSSERVEKFLSKLARLSGS